jgi:putative ABC transport system ATP-binding protein
MLQARLIVETGETAGRVITLDADEFSLGRTSDNDLQLKDTKVSRHHALIQRRGDRLVLVDLGSSNGTFVNDALVQGEVMLEDDATIRMGNSILRVRLPSARVGAAAPGDERTYLLPRPEKARRGPVGLLTLPSGEVAELAGQVSLGRDPANDVVLDDVRVSRQHAEIRQLDDGFVIIDLGSSNGTGVDGQRITGPTRLHDGAQIQIGQLLLRFSIRREEVAPAPATRIGLAALQAAADVTRVRLQAPVTVKVEDVVKTFGRPPSQVTALKGVALTIHQGEFVAVTGPSGSGKSTLMNIITGIDRPTEGEVIVNNQPLSALGENRLAKWRGRNIGIVFQFFQLLPTLSALENVMLPMDFCGTLPRRKRRRRGLDLLRMVNLEDKAHSLPRNLSGGQQQRVAIARALANNPPLLVCDEPTGNLDSKTARDVFLLLSHLAQRGTTVVMVTHDPLLAREVPRHIEILDGEVVQAT